MYLSRGFINFIDFIKNKVKIRQNSIAIKLQQNKRIDSRSSLTSIVIIFANLTSSKTLFRTLYDQRLRSYRRLKILTKVIIKMIFSVFIQSSIQDEFVLDTLTDRSKARRHLQGVCSRPISPAEQVQDRVQRIQVEI